MKTLLIALTTMLLFSGCVYRAPGTTHHVSRTTYTYVTPASKTYPVKKERVVYTNGRENKEHHHHDQKKHPTQHPDTHSQTTHTIKSKTNNGPKVHPQYYRNEPDIKKRTAVQPTVHPQYRKPQETKNNANLKHKQQHQKNTKTKRKQRDIQQHKTAHKTDKTVGPKIHPKNDKKQNAEHRKESGPKIHPQYADNKKRPVKNREEEKRR